MKKLITLCFVLILHLPTVLLQCDKTKWKCKNDECIAGDLLCDGKADCKDSSDETAAACQVIPCPDFSFRCAYGACIDGDLKCNGEKNCHDNSDETSRDCPDPDSPETTTIQPNCGVGMFECVDKTCIADDKECDGKPDCPDESDETFSTCEKKGCPEFSFKCDYGACVDGDATCDGEKDCIDGSDENFCGCLIDNIPYLQVTLTANNNDVRIKTYVKNNEDVTYKCPENYFLEGLTTNLCLDNSWRNDIPKCSYNGCLVDNTPNLQVILSSIGTYVNNGTYVADMVAIKYQCDKTYSLEGVTTNFCFSKSWTNPVPMCTKYCSPIKGITINPTCTRNEEIVSCVERIKPGTKAKIACSFIYQKPDRPDRPVHEDINCDHDGEWDYSPFRCEQICGEKPPPVTAFILSGQNTIISQVPWHVAIYSNLNGTYEQICGGTIITPKIVISAAHCFWNDDLGTVRDKSHYTVAAGKYFRQYDAAEPNLVQFTNISDITVPRGFQGMHYNYMSDLAVLALNEDIRYNYYIRPACLEWRLYAEKDIASEIIGIVAGWGLDETQKSSSELRSIELPTLGRTDCIKKVKPNQIMQVNSDKFCIDSRNGGNVCSGDSGGGFLIPKKIKDVDHYYLEGIVSNGLTNFEEQGQCKGDFVTTFTNVQFYKDEIEDAKDKARI